MVKTRKEKTMHFLKSETFKTSQSFGIKQYIKYKNRTLLLEIERDSYIKQSHAFVKMFDGDKWNMLCSIPPYNIKTDSYKANGYCKDKIYEADFVDDVETLLSEIELILN